MWQHTSGPRGRGAQLWKIAAQQFLTLHPWSWISDCSWKTCKINSTNRFQCNGGESTVPLFLYLLCPPLSSARAPPPPCLRQLSTRQNQDHYVLWWPVHDPTVHSAVPSWVCHSGGWLKSYCNLWHIWWSVMLCYVVCTKVCVLKCVCKCPCMYGDECVHGTHLGSACYSSIWLQSPVD